MSRGRSRTSHGPAPDAIATRALALAAIAGVFAIGHSMVVPVTVSRAAPAAVGPVPSDVTRNGGTTPPGEVATIPIDPVAGDEPTPPVVVVDEELKSEPQPEPMPQPQLPPGYLDLAGGYALWERGAWFFDARREVEFLAGHIEGAIFMPSNRVFTDEGQADLAMVPLDATVVLYCVGGDCDSSENAAVRLEDFGFARSNLLIMKAGYDDWLAAGYPVNAPAGSGGSGTGGTP